MKSKIKLELNAEQYITANEIKVIAKESKFIQRKNGKIDPVDFLFTLIFKVSTSNPLSLGHVILFLKSMVSRPGLHKKFNK